MTFSSKKSTRDIRIRAYKFRVYPENQQKSFPSDIMEEIFEQTRLMNDLWNRLAEIRRATLEALSIIHQEEFDNLERSGKVVKRLSSAEFKKLSPVYQSRSQALWQSYEKQIKEAAADVELVRGLNWEAREDVVNRFESAHRRNLKNGGEIKFIAGYIRKFHFPHRFTGGGRRAALIHTGRSKKLFVEAVPAVLFESESYRNRLKRVVSGSFGIGMNDCVQIPFRLVMHRRIPETAKIKQAILTGKVRNRVWEYFLVLIVEDQIQANSSSAGKPVAGIDLGWRKFENYIRFGMVADSNGNIFELRLPHSLEKQQNLRRLERLLAKHGSRAPNYPQTWDDIEKWQQANDIALEQTKKTLAEIKLPRSEKTQPLLNNLVNVRKTGLLNLLRALESSLNDNKNEDRITGSDQLEKTVKAVALLTSWREAHFAREKAIGYCQERLINYRNHHYRLAARWLKDNYAQIALVADLPLQKIVVEAATVSLLQANGAIMRNAAKYRCRVALSELLKQLKQNQNGTAENWLHSVKGGRTSTRCLTCGEWSPKTSQLITECSQGHRHDRDLQEAVNLLKELSNPNAASLGNVKIPDNLRNIIYTFNDSENIK